MSTATVSSKFRLSIPKALREAMRIQPGQQFELIHGIDHPTGAQDLHQGIARHRAGSESCSVP